MTYQLGEKSKAKLVGVHPTLVKVVNRTIQLTTQDFAVHDGLRTLEYQKKLVAKGASRTMNSKHLKQSTGYGHAVDLVPFSDGVLKWEWPLIYPIISAVHQAATEQGVAGEIVWGGCWALLSDLGGSPKELEKAINAYSAARRKMGKSAFLDGPHVQLGK